MTLKAYLDGNGTVLVTSTEDRTLEQVEGILHAVVTVVDPAPAGLKALYATTAVELEYHRKKPGASGAALGDYDLREFLGHAKGVRFNEIKAKTAVLTAGLTDSEADAARRAEVLEGDVNLTTAVANAQSKVAIDAIVDARV
jgi:hypothetical protein